jgi:hypothetical protein
MNEGRMAYALFILIMNIEQGISNFEVLEYMQYIYTLYIIDFLLFIIYFLKLS